MWQLFNSAREEKIAKSKFLKKWEELWLKFQHNRSIFSVLVIHSKF